MKNKKGKKPKRGKEVNMLIQDILNQLNADRNLFESVWQGLGISEAEANRRVTIIDHNIETITKVLTLIDDTDLLNLLTRSTE